jgi:hypothetical protein
MVRSVATRTQQCTALAIAPAIHHARTILNLLLCPMPATSVLVAFRTRLLMVLALTTINSALYLLSNKWPLHSPVFLPVNAVDAALAWHAWTIWPYWFLLLLGPLLALGLRDRRILMATLRAYALAMLLNFVIWSSWPTRMIFNRVLPQGLDPITEGAWRLLYALDGPNNCFPSGHITIPLVIAAGFCVQYPRARYWLVPLLLVLFPSVVTTGQHYSWDVLGGAMTATLGLLIAGRELKT